MNWRDNPAFDPLIERLQELADLKWEGRELPQEEFERILGHPLHEPRNRWERGNEYAHRSHAAAMEIVRVCRKLSDAGFPFSYAHEIRGALSRNEIKRY